MNKKEGAIEAKCFTIAACEKYLVITDRNNEVVFSSGRMTIDDDEITIIKDGYNVFVFKEEPVFTAIEDKVYFKED